MLASQVLQVGNSSGTASGRAVIEGSVISTKARRMILATGLIVLIQGCAASNYSVKPPAPTGDKVWALLCAAAVLAAAVIRRRSNPAQGT